MTTINIPVIGQIRSLEDVQRSLENIRSYFVSLSKVQEDIVSQISRSTSSNNLLPGQLRAYFQGLMISFRDDFSIAISAGSIEIGSKIYYAAGEIVYENLNLNGSTAYYVYVEAPITGYLLSDANIVLSLTKYAWDNDLGGYYEAGNAARRYLGAFATDSDRTIGVNSIIPAFISPSGVQNNLTTHINNSTGHVHFNTAAILGTL